MQKIFETDFSDLSIWNGQYIEPTETPWHRHGIVPCPGGGMMHESVISSAMPDNKPHRMYGCLRFLDPFKTPCLISLEVWTSILLAGAQWNSLATFCSNGTDAWDNVTTLNLDASRVPYLMHVPRYEERAPLYQAKLPLLKSGWSRLHTYLDYSPNWGYAKVFNEDKLVSAGRVEAGDRVLRQVHFGGYTDSSVASGFTRNRRIRIMEVENEAQADQIIRTPW